MRTLDVRRSALRLAGTEARKRARHTRADRDPPGSGRPPCGRARIPDAPDPDVVVPVAWFVPVTVRHAGVPRIIVPGTAPQRFGFIPIDPVSQKISPGGVAAFLFPPLPNIIEKGKGKRIKFNWVSA